MALTTEQKKQIDRLSRKRKAELDMEKLGKYTPEQLRARVNVLGVAGGVVNYAPENTQTGIDKGYTAKQQEAIAEGLRPGDKWLLRIAELIAEGPAIRQRVAALEEV